MKRYYSIGEIYRGGMLLNHKKVPYTDKGTISKLVARMDGVKVQSTPWGPAKMVPADEIEKHNQKFSNWSSFCPNCGGNIGECKCSFSDWYNNK